MGGFWCDTCGTWQPTESEAARRDRLSTLSARVVEAAVEWGTMGEDGDSFAALKRLHAAVDDLIAEQQR